MKKILAILLLLSLGSLAFAKEHKSEHKEFHHKKEIGYTLSPLPNATNVAADTKIKVIFDEKVERKTLKHSHIVLKYVEKHHKKAKHKKIKPIKGQSYFSRAENALIFLPHHELQEGEYEVSIDGIGHKPIRYTFSVSAIQDTTPPTITLNGSDTITLNRKQSYIEYGATATDDVDGNLSVSITNNVDTNTTGTYQVIYSAKDSAGNEATATRSVEVLPLLNSLTLSSEVTTLHIGDTSTLSVSGTYEDGFTKDLTQTVNYNVADTTIGIMNENIFEALNVGTTTLSVNYAGVSSNSITISVIEPIDTTNFNATYFGSQYLQYIPKDATVTKYDEDLFCMLTGKILVEDGTGLAGVKVTVLNHPEYGSQVTDANGSYVFATKGGVTLTMRYQKDGYTTIDRKVEAPIQEWGIAPEVTMLPIDSKVTTINLESLTPQLHVSTPITDDRGTRSTTLVFNGVTQAIITAKDGTTRELQSIDVRATEFKTPTSMPSDLPSTSAYTYCSDLTVDGVSDDENVTFNAPVIMYVENFLGFDVGEIVPVGYYDRNKGKWIGSENGAVVKLLDTDGDGKVDAVDSTGDDQPNDLDGDGLYSDEVVGLQDNSNYQAGLTYWRAAITHFTPWDHNWPYGPPDDADKPDDPDIDDDNPDDPCKVSLSSYVEPKKRIFHEDIPIAGTNETLHYSSKSVDGYTYVIDASVDTTTAPSSAIGATATLKVGGRTFVKQVSLNQLNTLKFKWDGYDVSGHKMSGDVKAIITIAYQYQPVYYASNTTFSQAWAKVGSTVTAIRGRSTIDLQTKKTVIINVENTNSYSGHLANGWMFSDDFYQLDKLKNKEFTYTISTVTGNGARGFSGDYRYATNAALFFPHGIAINQAGELFIASSNSRIRKVDTNGIITTVAGNGARGFSGDGGDATNASLLEPRAIAINQVGELFIADTYNNRIRKVDTNGIITTVAGNGARGFSGDNGDATNTSLFFPQGIAINQAGELFIADTINDRIRKLIPSKIHQKYNLDTSKYIYKNPDNTIEIYDSTGKHLKTFDLETEKTLKEYTYDSNGYLSTITDQFGNTLSITRDANGYPTEITAPNGQKAYLQVDDNGDLIDVWYEDNSGYNFTYFDGSLMDTMTDRNGNKILHIYDENGRITQETDAAGGTWQFAKSGTPKAPVYSMTKPEGSVTSGVNEKQDDGSIIATRTLPTGDTLTITTSADEKTQTTQSNGITTTVNYTADSFTQDKILSSSTTTQPSGLSQTTTYVTKYDGNTTQTNVKTKKVTSNGKTTISKTDYTTGEITFTTPESRVLTTLYNKENRLTTSIQSGTLTPTTYEYDTKGRVVSETTGDRVVSYTYDQRGNIATITTPNNETTNYEYDVMDKVTKITYPNGNTELYAYDANGNMTRLSTPTPTDFTFTYNGVDKRTSLISPSNYTTSYTYNKNRKLTSITRPSGATITNNYTNDRLSSTVTPEGTINYNYLFADQLSSISMGSESIEYSYDGDLLTSLTQNGTLDQSINYTYNNDFAVTSTSYAGVTTTYSYDNDGLLTQSGDFTLTRDPDNGYVTNVTDGTLSIDKEYNNYAELTQHSDNTLSYTLQRNLEGNIIQKIETVGGTINTYNYTYDENSRLITVEKNNQIVESYTYDKNSNRISATINGVTTQATYDQEDAIDTYGDNTYTYDTDGQLNQKITNEGITTYSYNSQGTLTKVVTPTNTIEYILNPLGQRVAKKVDGTITEKYLWADLTTLLATLDANNNIIQRYNYTDSRVPTSMQQDGETYYLHYDQVGTLKAISDTNHNIVKEITYDTYGNIQNDTNPNFQIPFGFAGGLQDQDTQLVHFGYREYDPYTGKWTTKDPIDFSGGDSNLYGYVLQDPVNLVDPEGLMGKGGNQNHKSDEFRNYSDDELEKMYKDPCTSKELKQKIKKEQKARKIRNQQKRKKIEFDLKKQPIVIPIPPVWITVPSLIGGALFGM
ncbi:RHS repeat-associated core domain-containing protein [Sulfurimonas sp.]|uniref:NHL domain-containing protein n=1 Tax=Sulfurimonas sp. TaxID=2022749 RepID=UPI003D0C87C9